MDTKVCSKCGEEKPINKFYKQRRSKDGYRGVCKKCTTGYDPKYKYRLVDDTSTEKECVTCKEILTLEKYSIIKIRGKEYYQSSCRQCKNLYIAMKRKKLNSYWKRDLRLKYNITEEYFNGLIDNQNSSCAICGKEFANNKKPCVDHCHNTGRVRGLLCSNCNSGIGMLGDSIENLKAAVLYLENF